MMKSRINKKKETPTTKLFVYKSFEETVSPGPLKTIKNSENLGT